MENYIIQFSVFLCLFFAAYLLFFKRETFFQINRVYLLLTPVLALILPFLSFDFFQEKIKISQATIHLPSVLIGNFSDEKLPETTVVENQTFWNSLNFLHILIGIYILGIAFSIFLLVRKILAYQKLKTKGTLTVFQEVPYWKIPNTRLAFTFLNQIFIGENIQSAEKKQILQHELVHVKQNHTFDLLFMELLKVIFWFHPAVYGYQHQLKILHEFIADKEVSRLSSTRNYYENLLNSIFNTEKISFINQFFNHSLIKKRIVMLQKSKSKARAKFKYLLLIPLVFGMLTYVSCSEDNKINETEYKTKNIKVSEMTHNQIIDHYWNELDSLNAKTENLGELEKKFFYGTLGDISNPFFSINFYYKKEVYFIWLEYKENRYETSNKYDIESFDEYVKSINKDGVLFAEIENYENPIPFTMVDKIPYYKECKLHSNKDDLLQCTSAKISEYVMENFRKSKELSEDLPVGVYRIFAEFTIDKSGNSTDVDIRTSNSRLSNSALEIIKKLPVFVPGEKDGNKVNVRFTLPIIFQVEK